MSVKKLAWGLLAAVAVQSGAQAAEHEALWKWIEPLIEMGTQQAFEEDDEKNPLYRSCVRKIFSQHVLPEVKAQTIQSTMDGAHAADAQALEAFMSQEREVSEYNDYKAQFDQLSAEGKSKAAEALWEKYIKQAGGRMPKQAQQGAQALLDAMDLSTPLENLNFKDMMMAEPVCMDYVNSLNEQ